jgi:hypothetical protein
MVTAATKGDSALMVVVVVALMHGKLVLLSRYMVTPVATEGDNLRVVVVVVALVHGKLLLLL